MKTPALALVLALLSLPFGCKVEDDGPDPLATREGFCDAWADRACQKDVLEACNTPKVADCRSAQADFCLDIIPVTYSSKHASACLSAVKNAYEDAKLTAAEVQVVLKLGAPCDQLSKGIAEDGESCSKNEECNTADGFTCITKLGSTDGICGKPEPAGPGEPCDGPNQVCEDGNFCTGDYCVVYKATGKACAGDYECSPDDRCVVEADAKMGTCLERAPLSDDCMRDDDCQSHYCVVPSGETVGKCASTLRLSINEPLCDSLR